jgi:hypothetical protein
MTGLSDEDGALNDQNDTSLYTSLSFTAFALIKSPGFILFSCISKVISQENFTPSVTGCGTVNEQYGVFPLTSPFLSIQSPPGFVHA